MKKMFIFLIVALLSLTGIQTTLAAPPRNPVQDLLNRVAALEAALAPVDMSGCWEVIAASGVLTSSSGSVVPSIIPITPGVLFLNLSQTGGDIEGTLTKTIGGVTTPYPMEGKVYGPFFAIYTSGTSASEFRYFTGSVKADGNFRGMGVYLRTGDLQFQSIIIGLQPSSLCPQ